jgi:hypothetical protein
MLGNNGIKWRKGYSAPLCHSNTTFIHLPHFHTMKKYLLFALAIITLLPNILCQNADENAAVYATSKGAIKGYDPPKSDCNSRSSPARSTPSRGNGNRRCSG